MFENCFSQPELTLMRSVGKQKKLPSQFNGSNHSKKKKKKKKITKTTQVLNGFHGFSRFP